MSEMLIKAHVRSINRLILEDLPIKASHNIYLDLFFFAFDDIIDLDNSSLILENILTNEQI